MTDQPPVLDLASDRASALSEAAAAVTAGECIVLPTDTVYGIGADAFNAGAVQRLLDAKERAGVGAFLQAGLVSRSEAETLVARRDAVPLSRRAVG